VINLYSRMSGPHKVMKRCENICMLHE